MNSWRDILKFEQEQRSLSLRGFAEFLQVSPSFLTRLLKNERTLSEERAYLFSRQLWQDPAKQEQFVRLTKQEQTKSEDYARFLQGKSNEVDEIEFFSTEQMKFLSHWCHFAILELVRLSDFKFDEHWIAKRLAVDSLTVSAALERLIKLNILTKQKNGTVSRENLRQVLTSAPSAFLRKIHKQMLEKAILALEQLSTEERHNIGNVMAINAKKFPEAKRMIDEFALKLGDFLNQEQECDSLCYLNINFFRIDKK